MCKKETICVRYIVGVSNVTFIVNKGIADLFSVADTYFFYSMVLFISVQNPKLQQTGHCLVCTPPKLLG